MRQFAVLYGASTLPTVAARPPVDYPVGYRSREDTGRDEFPRSGLTLPAVAVAEPIGDLSATAGRPARYAARGMA